MCPVVKFFYSFYGVFWSLPSAMIGVSVTASTLFQHFPPAEMKAGWQGHCCAVDIVASSLKVEKENIK